MKTDIERVPGIGPHSAKVLTTSGFDSIDSLANATVEQLSTVPGFGAARAGKVIRSAAALVSASPSDDVAGSTVVEKAPQAPERGEVAAKNLADEKISDKKNKTTKKKKKKKKKKKRNDPVSVWAAYKRAVRKKNPPE